MSIIGFHISLPEEISILTVNFLSNVLSVSKLHMNKSLIEIIDNNNQTVN